MDAYRGQDRRSVISDDRRSPGSVFLLTGISMLALAVLALSFPGRTSDGGAATLDVLTTQLNAGAFAVGLVLAALCFLGWRLVGEARLLWLGVAAATYGIFTLDLGYVEAIHLATGNEMLLLLRPAGQIVAVALAAFALLSPDVDATLRPSKVLIGALVAVTVTTLGLQLVPSSLVRATTASGLTASDGGASPVVALGLGGIWLVVGAWSLWLGLRRRPILAWFALMFTSFSAAELLSLAAVASSSVGVASPGILRLLGLLGAVLGTTSELARAYLRQGTKLLESVTSSRTAEARIEAERATQAERAHEARNALAAIEGATRTLQRYQDQIDPRAREELAEAVSAEVHRLQQLVSVDPTSEPPGRFRLTEALAAVVTSARWQGLTVSMDVPEHLVAIGQPADTTQVFHNLFQNASRYAGRSVSIQASLEGEQVAIRVADDGPGIPLDEREVIFTRGFRGANAHAEPGSGLGLYIAARLMRQQGGDLRLEESDSGGACFVVCLPGFSELGADGAVLQHSLDEPDEGAQLGVVRQRRVIAFPNHRQRAANRVDDDDGVRDELVR